MLPRIKSFPRVISDGVEPPSSHMSLDGGFNPGTIKERHSPESLVFKTPQAPDSALETICLSKWIVILRSSQYGLSIPIATESSIFPESSSGNLLVLRSQKKVEWSGILPKKAAFILA